MERDLLWAFIHTLPRPNEKGRKRANSALRATCPRAAVRVARHCRCMLIQQERLLSKSELAKYLGFSERWIDMQVARGMPYIQVGSRRRFDLSEVLDWFRDERRRS